MSSSSVKHLNVPASPAMVFSYGGAVSLGCILRYFNANALLKIFPVHPDKMTLATKNRSSEVRQPSSYLCVEKPTP